MNKLTLIGLNSDKEKILERLMEQGVTEIVDKDRLSSEEWSSLMEKDGDSESVQQLGNRIEKVASALGKLSGYEVQKKSLFESKRSVSKDEFDKVVRDEDRIWTVVDDIMQLAAKQEELKSEKNKTENFIHTLEPWKSHDVPLDFMGTKSTVVSLGVVPASVDVGLMEKELAEQVPESYMKCINRDKYQSYLFLICHIKLEEETARVMKKYGFTKVSFNDIKGTAAENINAAREKVSLIDKQIQEIKSKIKAYAVEKPDVETYYDCLVARRDRKKALGSLLKTESVFMLEGWLPRDLSETLRKDLTGSYECIVDIEEPEKDEDFPVLLSNGKVGQAVESITEMYGLPNCREIDPNTVMAPFFVIFFGLMLGDGGYGLVITIAGILALWKFKFNDEMKKTARLILYCGISTMFWGLMFGSWFGIAALAERPVWLNPVEQPEEMLKWSLLFGVIHIYVGIGVRGANQIRRKKYLDAVLDTLPWYIFFTGFIMFVLPYVPNTNAEALGPVVDAGIKLFIIGGVILVLTQGRDGKTILQKLIGGIAKLYDVVSFMSDILSYSRLMALGLATSVIGSIINEMGAMGGLDNILKILLFIFILLVGHAINFAINALGAYVHSSRLQYIEFFGKFYEGGGKPFKPLKYNTKYINLKIRR